ncbi:hypothetical protein [Alkalihalobacillus sp. AL-G]|uniref:hypothetical protein n=1 Tax=Alkalihalobacillus sp. AL-G TaxID=2926399 RepID=UPI00272B932A|nr:hypothetical protein [Alkalihalobacillus sp. AL-G]WLD92244.1 hypothetical protein MOJ78_14610 [Alkalihalobacillus sp. AL-G]
MEHFSSQKRLLILLSSIVVLLLAAGCFYVLYPSKQRIHALESEIKVNAAFLEVAKDNSQEKDDSLEIRENHHTVPVGPSTDQMIRDLNTAEKNSKSAVQKITVKNEGEVHLQQGDSGIGKSLDVLQPLTFSLVVRSPDYSSIRSFINSIENSERVYVIEELNLPGREKNLENPYEYQVEITTFFQKVSKEKASN